MFSEVNDRNPIGAWLTRGHPSHAVSEVLTSRGWMLVDSNSEWIAITRDGHPVGADIPLLRLNEFETVPSYFTVPGWAIRGLYSRRGQFYNGWFVFPEVSWADFLAWVIYA